MTIIVSLEQFEKQKSLPRSLTIFAFPRKIWDLEESSWDELPNANFGYPYDGETLAVQFIRNSNARFYFEAGFKILSQPKRAILITI